MKYLNIQYPGTFSNSLSKRKSQEIQGNENKHDSQEEYYDEDSSEYNSHSEEYENVEQIEHEDSEESEEHHDSEHYDDMDDILADIHEYVENMSI